MADILFLPLGPLVGSLRIQAGVRYLHSQQATISEHPIETGSDLSDHRQVQRPQLRIEGVLSGAPAEPELAEQANGREHIESYDELLTLFEGEAVFTVVTPLRVYENMQMTSLSVPDDASSAFSVPFTAEMKQVVFANSETVPFEPETGVKQPSQRRGKKPTQEADEQTSSASRSTLSSLGVGDARERLLKGLDQLSLP